MLQIPAFLLRMHIRENEYPQNFVKSYICKNIDLLNILFFRSSLIVFEMNRTADSKITASC